MFYNGNLSLSTCSEISLELNKFPHQAKASVSDEHRQHFNELTN